MRRCQFRFTTKQPALWSPSPPSISLSKRLAGKRPSFQTSQEPHAVENQDVSIDKPFSKPQVILVGPRRANRAKLAPCCANSNAKSRPMPALAPVMSTLAAVQSHPNFSKFWSQPHSCQPHLSQPWLENCSFDLKMTETLSQNRLRVQTSDDRNRWSKAGGSCAPAPPARSAWP